MSNSVRGNNSSPGIYFKETEVGYSAKSLGITSLGVAGETLKGPAFENVPVADWTQYEAVFGGTSTKKFKGTQYPKYELPFIAKSYLTESKQLNVVRVLGLSGYNAGPAWYLKDDNDKVIAVLRSRGHYEKYGEPVEDENGCVNYSGYDKLVYDATAVTFDKYATVNGTLNCKTNPDLNYLDYFNEIQLTADDFGRLTIIVADRNGEEHKYAVSLNAYDRDYILTVLGTKPDDSSALIFVEELYDVALGQAISEGKALYLNKEPSLIKKAVYAPLWEPVAGILTLPETELRRGYLNLRFICTEAGSGFTVYEKDETGATPSVTSSNVGDIVVVKYFRAGEDTEEAYHYLLDNEQNAPESAFTPGVNEEVYKVVYVESEGKYFLKEEAKPFTYDLNNYKERFRSAVTPWFVSQLLGVGDELNVKKLFRFITISDGNAANGEVKISIEKILPDEGLFDVIVRSYDDSDTDPVVLEKFNKCSLDPQASGYIGKKIGTANGEFELKSAYVMVEIADDDTIFGLVPCGFMGYPVRKIAESGDSFYDLRYNVKFNSDIRPRKQYFGLSDLVGVDIDVLNYKGVTAYSDKETSDNGYTNGFHLDMRLSYSGSTIHVDGETGYTFDCVTATSQSGNGSSMIPVITTEPEMSDTIYSDVNLRKFTAFPYGGYDAWDDYRKQRTNTDEFKINKYKGTVVNGEYENFTTHFDKDGLGLDGIKAMSSDYYAYLAAYRQFANPEAVDINLIATPGIDLINNTLLVDEVLNIIEDDDDGRNGDVLYIPTAPDKPAGASDAESDMYTPSELVELIKDTEISDSYVATYYPWVKYFDQPSGTYIMLPPTKDVMRNFAYVDNHSAPWFAAAGTKEENGAVNCVKAHKFTKRQDENILYDNYVNPVKTFAKDGVKIWGNKTLYFNDESPLNRINVRRLMLRVKKLISGAGRVLIFDQNDGTLERQFRSIVEPILANVRDNRGITDYRLDVLNSAECDAEHELNAKIWIKPTPTLEYIGIEFMITPQCIKFDE